MSIGQAFGDLFGAYFHEDWVDDYGTWENTVDAFASDNPSDVATAARQIEQVLAGGEVTAAEALREVGCCFSAKYFGKNYAGWLDEVVQRLRAFEVAAASGASRTAS